MKVKKPIWVLYLDQLLLPLICILFILLLMSFSKTAVVSASEGLSLWINIVFPSLFPFFVASYVLNSTGFMKAAGVLFEPIMWPLFKIPGCGSFAFAMGITSGYPMGAVVTTGLYEQGLLTKNQAERLLAFTNNSGPLFIIGAVATGMLGKAGLGIYLLVCHVAASLTVGIILRFFRDRDDPGNKSGSKIIKKFKRELFSTGKSRTNIGILFGDAVKNSIMTLFTIGGFIILFSVIINLLIETGFIEKISVIISTLLKPLKIDTSSIIPVISGFFEITTGVNTASKTFFGNLAQQLSVISFIIGWAGLSVHFQVFSIISRTNLSLKPYLFGKLLHGIFSATYAWAGIKILGFPVEQIKEVFGQEYSDGTINWYLSIMSSCKYLFITLAVIGTIIILSCLFKPAYPRTKLKSRV